MSFDPTKARERIAQDVMQVRQYLKDGAMLYTTEAAVNMIERLSTDALDALAAAEARIERLEHRVNLADDALGKWSFDALEDPVLARALNEVHRALTEEDDNAR